MLNGFNSLNSNITTRLHQWAQVYCSLNSEVCRRSRVVFVVTLWPANRPEWNRLTRTAMSMYQDAITKRECEFVYRNIRGFFYHWTHKCLKSSRMCHVLPITSRPLQIHQCVLLWTTLDCNTTFTLAYQLIAVIRHGIVKENCSGCWHARIESYSCKYTDVSILGHCICNFLHHLINMFRLKFIVKECQATDFNETGEHACLLKTI